MENFKEMDFKIDGRYTDRTRKLFELCNLRTDGKLQNEFFAEWFILSFPDETYESYIVQWIDRFMSGTPFCNMDSERLKIYIDLINKKWS